MRTSAFSIALAYLCSASVNAGDFIRQRSSTTHYVSAPVAVRRAANNDGNSFGRLLTTAESLSFSVIIGIEVADISMSLQPLEPAGFSMSMLILEPAEMEMSMSMELSASLGSLSMSASMSAPETEPLPAPGLTEKPEEPQIDVLPESPKGPPGSPDALVSSGAVIGTAVSALAAAGAIMLL